MALIYIYDGATGKLLRSQEPSIDPLETSLHGETVYASYPNSTEVEPPIYGVNEAPYFNIESGEWEIRGQYRGVEVYNKDTKFFEYCETDELGENQIYIKDREGINNYKNNPKAYIITDAGEVINNPQYATYLELVELENQYNAADEEYENILDTPIVFPVTGKLYKPRWTEDGTYANLITAKLAGLGNFPIDIWDATKLEENKVSMDEEVFGMLCAFLVNIQRTAFDARKAAQAALIPLIEAKKQELGVE